MGGGGEGGFIYTLYRTMTQSVGVETGSGFQNHLSRTVSVFSPFVYKSCAQETSKIRIKGLVNLKAIPKFGDPITAYKQGVLSYKSVEAKQAVETLTV